MTEELKPGDLVQLKKGIALLYYKKNRNGEAAYQYVPKGSGRYALEELPSGKPYLLMSYKPRGAALRPEVVLLDGEGLLYCAGQLTSFEKCLR